MWEFSFFFFFFEWSGPLLMSLLWKKTKKEDNISGSNGFPNLQKLKQSRFEFP